MILEGYVKRSRALESLKDVRRVQFRIINGRLYAVWARPWGFPLLTDGFGEVRRGWPGVFPVAKQRGAPMADDSPHGTSVCNRFLPT